MKAKQTLPIILATEEAKISDHRQKLETLLPHVETMTQLYFGFPFANEGATVQTIFSNTENEAGAYARTHLPENLSVPGMELDPIKVSALMSVTGMNAFRDSRDQIKAIPGAEGLLSYFEIVDKIPAIDETRFAQWSDRYSVAVRTESDLELYTEWQSMINALIRFDRLVKPLGINFMAGLSVPRMSGFLKEDRTGEIVVNPQFFQAVQKDFERYRSNPSAKYEIEQQ